MSHTPGPWKAQLADGEWRILAASREHGINGYLGGMVRGGPHATADARLIASAPELLEALKSLTAALEGIREEQASHGLGFGRTPEERMERKRIIAGYVREYAGKIDDALMAALAAIRQG